MYSVLFDNRQYVRVSDKQVIYVVHAHLGACILVVHNLLTLFDLDHFIFSDRYYQPRLGFFLGCLRYENTSGSFFLYLFQILALRGDAMGVLRGDRQPGGLRSGARRLRR